MWSRVTSDYSPTRTGSREEKAAMNARAEMMKAFGSIVPKRERRPKRKTWAERMEARTHVLFAKRRSGATFVPGRSDGTRAKVHVKPFRRSLFKGD